MFSNVLMCEPVLERTPPSSKEESTKLMASPPFFPSQNSSQTGQALASGRAGHGPFSHWSPPRVCRISLRLSSTKQLTEREKPPSQTAEQFVQEFLCIAVELFLLTFWIWSLKVQRVFHLITIWTPLEVVWCTFMWHSKKRCASCQLGNGLTII